MLLWLSLLVLAPVSEQLATVPKPVITLSPPWTIVFQRETVLLTCKGFHDYPTGKTKWYYENPEHQKQSDIEIPGSTLETHNSGVYRCQIKDSPLSNPVNLIFTSASLILQAPQSVFEGDLVILRCRAKEDVLLNALTFYRNQKALREGTEGSDLHIPEAQTKDNGQYQCSGSKESYSSVSSNTVNIQVQDLFPRPELKASASRPTEGSQVTLTCETQLPPQRSDVQLQFRFFKNGQALESGWSSSPEVQITMWREHSGNYWCKAGRVNTSIQKQSSSYNIAVQRAVANNQILTHPDLEWVFEGKEMVLICSVGGVPGPITVSWYKISKKRQKEKIQNSQGAEFKISMVRNSDTGEYYCDVSNSYHSFSSKTGTINVKMAHPFFTLSAPGVKAAMEGVVDLHWETTGAFPLILYQQKFTGFDSGGITADSLPLPGSSELLPMTTVSGTEEFLKSVILKNIEAKSRRSASFSLTLTAEHSGNYHCTADNGLWAQSSEAVSLSVTVPVSQPVLTLRMPRTQALEGDLVTFHCEAQKGSPRILYQFFHEGKVLSSSSAPSGGGASFRLSLTTEHSGNYHCTADNGFGTQRSERMSISVMVLVSRPVLTLLAPKAQTVVGDVVELRCEAQRGSPPILYRFYHEYATLGSSSAPSGGGVTFNLCLTAEHSGNYYCTADNGLGLQRSDTVPLNVTVPVSRPVLTLRARSAQAVVGDVVELHCETQRGSPPILYRFYHNDVTLESSSAPSGGGASFSFSLTAEHSGNYSCEAENVLGAQRSEVEPLNITIPVSRPVLTLRVPGAQAVVGDMVELQCEAQRGSPPILYRFYHEDVTLGNSLALSGGRASFNLSLTAEHSGNYSCEADNGLGAQHSEVVTLNIRGLTGSRSGPVATGVTGGLLSMTGLAAVALLVYCRLTRKAGQKFDSDPTRSPATLDTQEPEPTYHNVPACIELQPVYSNVNPNGRDVVYSEVQCIQKKMKHAATATPGLLKHKDSPVIYSQVKVASALAS